LAVAALAFAAILTEALPHGHYPAFAGKKGVDAMVRGHNPGLLLFCRQK